MGVTDLRTDPEALTLTATAEYEAAPERVWALWSDARRLERWWGPPGWPATFREHALEPGAGSAYHMTGPDGARHNGWWRILDAEPPRRLRFIDGFADREGVPDPALPESTVEVLVEPVSQTLTRMTIRTRFSSAEAMRTVIEMGVEEGLRQAMAQIPALLAEG
jgi:uncharacterized protein YndB with AHSA1/START domain